MIVGIDPSLSALTLSFDVQEGFVTLESKPIRSETPRCRLARYETHADEMIDQILARGEPDLALIEGYSMNSQQGMWKLAEHGACLRQALLDRGWYLLEVAPTMLKKFATGKGNAKKAAVVSALSARYGVTFKTDDEADAFGLMQIGRAYFGSAEPANQHQREVIAKLREMNE